MRKGPPIMKKERLWTKDFTIVTLLNFFAFLTHMMVLSTFPFLVSFLGYSETISGICATLFSVVAVVSRIFIGYVLDSGKRKLILILGLAVIAFAPMGYLFVYAILASIVLAFIMRMIHALGFAMANTSAATIATDIIPKSRFAEGMGMFGLSTALATAAGPAVGEALMNIGFPLLYVATTLIMVLGVVLALAVKVPHFTVEKRKFAVKDLISVDALPASLVALIFVMSYGALVNYILKFATDVDHITIAGSWYFVAMAAMLTAARFAVSGVMNRRGERPFLYICCPAMFASLIVLAFIPGNVAFLVSGLLSGFGFGCIEPSLQAMAVSTSPAERRGAANSTFLCAFDIGIGVGAGIAGALIDHIGYYWMFGIISVTALVALLLYVLVGQRHATSLTRQLREQQSGQSSE